MELYIEHALIIKIVICLICGFIIGVERKLKGKLVGIRTSMMICLGTMLFIHVGQQIEQTIDGSRIMGQVVTGVGFLGAGVIMNKGGLVSGVTSASIVWLLAGIGCAIGYEKYSTALVISLVASFVLVGVPRIEVAYRKVTRKPPRKPRKTS